MRSNRLFFLLVTAVIIAFLSPALLGAQGADEVYSFAQSLKRDRLFEAASQQFLQFALENPSDERAPRALEHAADCFIEIDSLDDAVRVLVTLVDSYPEDPLRCQNRIRLGKLYHKMEKFEKANRTFIDIIVSDSDCPRLSEAVLGRGEALLALSRYSEARGVLEALIKTFDDEKITPRAYFGLALASAGLKDDKAALEAYTRLGKEFPKHPLSAFASLEAGQIYLTMGDSLSAVTSFGRAKNFKQKAIFVPASLAGAKTLEGMQRYREALDWYQELILIDDLSIAREAFESAARTAYLAGEYKEVRSLSLRFYKNEQFGFSPEITFFRAGSELKLAEFGRALDEARLLETRAPESARALYAPRLKGEALLAMGRPREAIPEFRRFTSAVSDSSARVETLAKLADIYVTALGDTAKALEILLEKLDVQKKSDPSEFLRIASLFEQFRNFREARRLYAEIVTAFPLSPEGVRAQGRLDYIDAFSVIDPSAALEQMEKAARAIISLPKPEGMLVLATARMEIMKDFMGAAALVDRALSSTEDGEVRAKALYYKGACYAGTAKKALALGDSSGARNALAVAAGVWTSLSSRYAQSSWAARAAYEKLFLATKVGGSIDTLAIFQTLSAYPSRSERARALELLGDYYRSLPGKVARDASIRHYKKALFLPDGLDDPADVRLKLAAALIRSGDFEGSLELSKLTLEDRRRSVHLRAAYQTGVSLRQLKRFREAFPFFMEVARGDAAGGTGAKARLHAADCLYVLKDFEKAVELYTNALDRAPDRRFAWEVTYRLALCWEKLGETGEALELMEACLASPEGSKMRRRAYDHALKMVRSMGNGRRQGSLLERYVKEFKRGKDAAAAREELLRWYLANGAAEKALELTEEMVAQSTEEDLHRVQAFKAMALYRAGKLDRARVLEEPLKAREALSTLRWEVSLHSSWYQFETKNYQLSIAQSRPLAENCPEGAPCEEALYLLAMSLFASNKIEEAGEHAGRFFAKYPLSAFAPLLHFKFGNALASCNQYSEAAIHYREAAAASQDSATAFDSLKNQAIACQKISRWDEAARAWKELIARFPSAPYAIEASLNVARCKMEGGNLLAAIETYRQALPKLDDQGKARAYYWSGECFQKLADYKAAIAEYLKVPYLVPREALWGVTAQLKAAECYASIERFDSARKLYEKLIRQHGESSDWGKAAAKALEQLKAISAAREQTEGDG